MPKSASKKIVLASGNSGKVREIGALLASLDFEVIPQSHFDLTEVEETGLTFVENAIIKARHAAHLTGLIAIADDSGLEVDALNGAPGIYSSRFAGIDATDQQNVEKLLAELKEIPAAARTARFQCVIVYLEHEADPTPIICEGSWEGRILFESHGSHGFGYDPIFYVPDHNCASAELPPEIKNSLSHRGKALKQLLAALQPS
ncbi:MAG: non-canonical purine NTP pyrophosphatase, RdgB/HAM1 family [Thiotrichales bacterium]|nr:MAG: non-canonical purine NTP pyrophosphatase, RdgB/HAM1 family [Thiotrichales bacterium]PCI11410.1 MAG: non-canonical purine NTP pyrophosphatase, RdgB/HAM1 family [Thiotrichales bacterium]